MGSSPSQALDKAAIAESNKINAALERERRSFLRTIKILLLGSSEVGKSTILKQMKVLHCQGFTAAEYLLHKSTVLKEMLRALVVVSQAFLAGGHSFSGANSQAFFAIVCDEYRRIENTTAVDFERDVFVAVKALLLDAALTGFLGEFERTSDDATFYYLQHVERISATEFVPTVEDLLKLRIQTTGINEITFSASSLTFRVFDVGGQRSLRRKWLHVFENVNSVMFLFALSDYNLLMREDHVTNRMQDSLQLCVGIFNSNWFKKSSLILFANKKDLFEEKLKSTSLHSFFPAYSGDNSLNSAATFLEQKFVACCNDGERKIFVHRTCATDRDQMKLVIASCLATIMADNMKNSALS